MSTVQCVACRALTLRDHPGTTQEPSRRAAAVMARHGMGRCLKGPHYLFTSVDRQRECTQFQPAETATVQQRIEWLAKPHTKTARQAASQPS